MLYEIDFKNKEAKYNREVCSRMIWFGYGNEFIKDIVELPIWQIELIEEVLLAVKENRIIIEKNKSDNIKNELIKGSSYEYMIFKFGTNIDQIEYIKSIL